MKDSQQSALATLLIATLAGFLGGHGMDLRTSQMIAAGALSIGGYLVHHHSKVELLAAAKQAAAVVVPAATQAIEQAAPAQPAPGA